MYDRQDALSLQCLASYFFLYFACLAPIITFGGLLGDATKVVILSIYIYVYLLLKRTCVNNNISKVFLFSF
jgi:hypothetical protein